MARIVRLTERDLSRLVKRVINENMDNDTALNVYGKLKQEGEIMDETYKRIKNIREELDMMVMKHVRGGTANTIFDYGQRTPDEVSGNVQQLSRKIDELEGVKNTGDDASLSVVAKIQYDNAFQKPLDESTTIAAGRQISNSRYSPQTRKTY